MTEKMVYLSLGSNMGDREGNLRDAIAELPHAGAAVTKLSSFYETEPVDLREQPWFLNCALQATTEVPPLDLLRALRTIESRMGSKKLVPKGPRLIDLDILLYGDETIDTPELQVPHPRMLSRKFVLIPLAEIAPNLKHPSWKETASRLLADLPDSSVVRRFEPSV
jgi:2-amino-4-hydroxy-6-hydroxymethyldihydropteridine diphosphokinase